MSRFAALLPMLALVTACGGSDPGTLSRETFVRVNVALRLVPDSAPDAAARRAAILRRERVTAAQLEAWVRTHAGEDQVLMETWQRIAAKVDSARPAVPPVRPDSIRPEPAPQVEVALPPPPPDSVAPDSVAQDPLVEEPARKPARRPAFRTGRVPGG